MKRLFRNVKILSFVVLGVAPMIHAHAQDEWLTILQDHPFSYDLGIKILASEHPKAQVTICAHGYGHSNKIADYIKKLNVFDDHIVGFNFPDYRINEQPNPSKVHFGTLDEILPLLYILKRCIIDLQMPVINLYGFSAGGGAVVNVLAVLNKNHADQELAKIGIGADEKKRILKALGDGLIILNCPLKSIEEIIALRGNSPIFDLIAANFAKNNMRPIDNLLALEGLALEIMLHFQNPDEILSNRDDALFIERLRSTNKGKTTVVMGTEGGHNVHHGTLWEQYKKMKMKI